MAAYNGRSLSPGGRRIANQGRLSDNTLVTDSSSYLGTRHGSYAPPYISPRTSTGVIPLGSQTFINVAPTSTGRPRRSSLIEPQRQTASTSSLTSRSRPTIVQADTRAQSPPRMPREKDYYLSPNNSLEPRTSHKRVYSVDGSGGAKLVADVDVAGASRSSHKRRDSADRSNARESDRRIYYTNGSRVPDKGIDDDGMVSYTDAAGMYRDTQPVRREHRPRRGSVDRGTRPVSMLEPYDNRRQRDNRPPPSTRGWDKLGDGLNRSTSVRDASRSPSRSRTYDSLYPDDHHSHRRARSTDRRSKNLPDSRYESDHAPRRRERRDSTSRPERPDQSVERRGFGIRVNDDDDDRHDRYLQRGSDESLDGRSRRRETISDVPHRDERGSRAMAAYDERDSARDRDYREADSRRHEERRPKDYDRDYERDRQREPERVRQAEPTNDRDRQNPRRDGERERDRDYDIRKESSPKNSNDALGKAAAGGLVGAAAIAAAGKAISSRDADRDSRDDRYDKRDTRDIDDRRYDDSKDSRRDRRLDPNDSDDSYTGRSRRNDFDDSRRIGSTTTAPPKPLTIEPPPSILKKSEQDTLVMSPRDIGPRDGSSARPLEIPMPPVDPAEDYRRRLDQVQREMGRIPGESRDSDSDPEKQRLRREREQRQRERRERQGIHGSDPGVHDAPPYPGAVRNSLDGEQQSVAGTSESFGSELRRKPSILDMPMPSEPTAQIIDNSLSDKRENRVRIVDPPTEEEEKKPKSILKKPTEKFPEDPNAIREGVAPLKDATHNGIPQGARWTKIDRRLVNPEALEAAQERFEEREDYVIVLRVLTKEDIQKLADRTKAIRGRNYRLYFADENSRVVEVDADPDDVHRTTAAAEKTQATVVGGGGGGEGGVGGRYRSPEADDDDDYYHYHHNSSSSNRGRQYE